MGDIADAPHETAAVRADGERLASVFVCLWLAGGVRLAGRLELKQAAHTRERLVSVALGKEADHMMRRTPWRWRSPVAR